MTEKSAAREACFPSFPTIPTPEPLCQAKVTTGTREGLKLTNVGGLDHTNVVPSIPNTTYAFLGMFSDKASDVSLLGRRTPARNHGGEFGSDLYELVRE